jgi:hypothetical protein
MSIEQKLLCFDLEVGVARNKMQQKRVGLDVFDRNLGLGRNIRALLNDLERKLANRRHKGREFGIALGRNRLVQVLHPRAVVGLVGQELKNAKAALALQNGGDVSVRHAKGLDHLHQGSDRMQVVSRWRFSISVALGHDPKELFALLGLLDQANGLVAPGGNRADHPRKLHGVAQRQQGQFRSEISLGNRVVLFVGNERNKVRVLRQE